MAGETFVVNGESFVWDPSHPVDGGVYGGQLGAWAHAVSISGPGDISEVVGTANRVTVTTNDGVATVTLPNAVSGLTSVAATTFTGALTGNASTATTAAGVVSALVAALGTPTAGLVKYASNAVPAPALVFANGTNWIDVLTGTTVVGP